MPALLVLDTHVLIWWVNRSPELKARARREIHGAVAKGPVHASTISVFEIRTAVRRGRLHLGIPVEHIAVVRRGMFDSVPHAEAPARNPFKARPAD